MRVSRLILSTSTHHLKHAAGEWNIKAFIISLQAGAGADPNAGRLGERGQETRVGEKDTQSSHLTEGRFTLTEQRTTAGSWSR